MGIPEVIFSRLTTHSALAAIISTRTYPVVLPQNCTLPAITYQIIDIDIEPTIGYANEGSEFLTMQIDCWASTYDAVRALAGHVRAALMDWHQDSSPVITRINYGGEGDSYEPDTALYRVSMDFEVIAPL